MCSRCWGTLIQRDQNCSRQTWSSANQSSRICRKTISCGIIENKFFCHGDHKQGDVEELDFALLALQNILQCKYSASLMMQKITTRELITKLFWLKFTHLISARSNNTCRGWLTRMCTTPLGPNDRSLSRSCCRSKGLFSKMSPSLILAWSCRCRCSAISRDRILSTKKSVWTLTTGQVGGISWGWWIMSVSKLYSGRI